MHYVKAYIHKTGLESVLKLLGISGIYTIVTGNITEEIEKNGKCDLCSVEFIKDYRCQNLSRIEFVVTIREI